MSSINKEKRRMRTTHGGYLRPVVLHLGVMVAVYSLTGCASQQIPYHACRDVGTVSNVRYDRFSIAYSDLTKTSATGALQYNCDEGYIAVLGVALKPCAPEPIDVLPANVALYDARGRAVSRYEPDEWVAKLDSDRRKKNLMIRLFTATSGQGYATAHVRSLGSVYNPFWPYERYDYSSQGSIMAQTYDPLVQQMQLERLDRKLRENDARYYQKMSDAQETLLWGKTLYPGEQVVACVRFKKVAPKEWLLLSVQVGQESHLMAFRRRNTSPLCPQSLPATLAGALRDAEARRTQIKRAVHEFRRFAHELKRKYPAVRHDKVYEAVSETLYQEGAACMPPDQVADRAKKALLAVYQTAGVRESR